MIEDIKDIGNLDAFDSFKWAGDPLKRLNLVYGWNGSGKTTMSRVLNFLERRQIHIQDLAQVTFSVTSDAGQVRERDLAGHTLSIRVFNEDFIRENLHFDEGNAKPIVILGKANITLQKEITDLEIAKTNAEQAVALLSTRKRALPRLDRVLTDAATAVTQLFANTPLALGKYYGRSYNKARVDKLISDGVITAPLLSGVTLSSTDVDAARETVKKDWAAIAATLPATPDLDTLFPLATSLLRTQVALPPMERLSGDTPLRDWTKTGYDLHKTRSAKECLFCSGPLDACLLTNLALFFTNQIDAAKSQIDDLLRRIANNGLDTTPAMIDSSNLFPDLAERYLQLKDKVTTSAVTVKEALALLATRLAEKRMHLHDLTVMPDPVSLPREAIDTYSAALAEMNAVFQEHNARVACGSNERDKAARALELHTVASALIAKDYFQQSTLASAVEKDLASAQETVTKIQGQIDVKKAAIQDAALAVDRVNDLLRDFFGEAHLYLEVSPGGGGEVAYSLMSRAKIARHLSEGEKSVLALTYFFVKLDEEGFSKGQATVVIDDPVDSQDGVFLFRTFALLRRQVGNAGQLVVLTHNFEFFNLVRDWLVSQDKGANSGLYHIGIDRTGTTRTLVVDALPNLLREHKSEYQYLFSCLFRHEAGTKVLDAPLVANVARKVLEYFAGFKWSCKTTEQFTNIVLSRFVADNNRLKKGVGDFVVKFLHEYSHGQDFTRPVSAAMFEEKDIVKNVLEFIRQADKEHYDDLAKLCA